MPEWSNAPPATKDSHRASAAALNPPSIASGGSMNPKNAEELLSKPDVDGGLIGGASLKADQFAVIVDAATKG